MWRYKVSDRAPWKATQSRASWSLCYAGTRWTASWCPSGRPWSKTWTYHAVCTCKAWSAAPAPHSCRLGTHEPASASYLTCDLIFHKKKCVFYWVYGICSPTVTLKAASSVGAPPRCVGERDSLEEAFSFSWMRATASNMGSSRKKDNEIKVVRTWKQCCNQ